MDDLVTWLRAQLDDDERVARSAGWDNLEWSYDRETFTVSSAAYLIAGRKNTRDPLNDVDGEHIARWDPARALAEVDAKRRILDLYEDEARGLAYTEREGDHEQFAYSCRREALEWAVRLLALPYADRPGYRDEWRPA